MPRRAINSDSGAADLKKDRVRLWLHLLQATRAIETELNKRFRDEFSISIARFDVLVALSRHPRGLTMTAVSSHMLISNGNATAIIERLAADGLVERQPDANDKRVVIVRLTSAGKAEFESFAATHDSCVEQMLSTLDAADLQTMLALFKRMGFAKTARGGP